MREYHGRPRNYMAWKRFKRAFFHDCRQNEEALRQLSAELRGTRKSYKVFHTYVLKGSKEIKEKKKFLSGTNGVLCDESLVIAHYK